MSLESGTFVEDLVASNPPSNDTKSQGDDHIRLIKTTLRNTFKRATRFFTIPASVSKTANYSATSADDNLTVQFDTTSGALTLTLPLLAVGDAGFRMNLVKASADVNPVFVQTSGGQPINGQSGGKIRRSTVIAATAIYWTGAQWIATRPHGHLIGEIIDYYGAGNLLPAGFLWCDGSAVNSTNYPELFGVIGPTIPDFRGRVCIGRDDMGGSAANRITLAGSGINATALFAAGGREDYTGIFAAGAGGTNVLTSANSNVQPSCVSNKIICAE